MTAVETPPEDRTSSSRVRGRAIDAAFVALWFAVSGVVGAVVWWQVVDLPLVTKQGEAAALSPDQLVLLVGIDGWYFVIAMVGGLLGGVALLAWRGRDPLVTVALVVLGAGLAALLMNLTGLALGPGDELAALSGRPDGTEVPVRLRLEATGMSWVWPIAATFGALVQIWVLRKPDTAPVEPAQG